MQRLEALNMLSLVIPVYRNEENLDRLLAALAELDRQRPGEIEFVFVIDGSPDACREILSRRLPEMAIRSQLICLSRNFGSFSAVTAGLEAGTGGYFAVMAADLQEPPELILRFLDAMRNDEADVVFGYRTGRSDPWFSELMSNLFWFFYRRFVVPDMPRGGVDIFGCTRRVRDHVLRLQEANTNLIVLLLWLGFRRKFFGYQRRPRLEGRSAWTLAKKLRYSVDSVFNFTDLPIRLLLGLGAAGILVAAVYAALLIAIRLTSQIVVPGYTALALLILFFGSLTMLAFGIVGQYLWLNLQNVRRRPNYVVESRSEHSPDKKS